MIAIIITKILFITKVYTLVFFSLSNYTVYVKKILLVTVCANSLELRLNKYVHKINIIYIKDKSSVHWIDTYIYTQVYMTVHAMFTEQGE